MVRLEQTLLMLVNENQLGAIEARIIQEAVAKYYRTTALSFFVEPAARRILNGLMEIVNEDDFCELMAEKTVKQVVEIRKLELTEV